MLRGRPPDPDNVSAVISRLTWMATYGLDDMYVPPAEMANFVRDSAIRLVVANKSERCAALYLALIDHRDILALCNGVKRWTERLLRDVLLQAKVWTPAEVEKRVRAIGRRTDALRYALLSVIRDPEAALQRMSNAMRAAERSASRSCACGRGEGQVIAQLSPMSRCGYQVDGVAVCHECMIGRLRDPWIWEPLA